MVMDTHGGTRNAHAQAHRRIVSESERVVQEKRERAWSAAAVPLPVS